MARCADFVCCGVLVVVALCLQGCGEEAVPCAQKCGQYSDAAGSVDIKSKTVCMISSKDTGGLTMCTASIPIIGCKSPDNKVNATFCKQSMDPAAKQTEEGIVSAAATPACPTVCTEYKDGQTLESPAVCLTNGVCGDVKGCTRRLAEETADQIPKTMPAEEETAAATTAKDAQEITKDKPGGGVLCKPVAPAGAATASKAVEAAAKTTETVTEKKTLFLAGVLPDAVVTSFANFSMGLVAFGLFMMTAMGVVTVLRRHQNASDQSEELMDDSEEEEGANA